MSIVSWFQGVIAWLQTDGRLDLVTLGLALATFIYVGSAVAISIQSDLQTRNNQAKANLRAASVKRTAGQSRSISAA